MPAVLPLAAAYITSNALAAVGASVATQAVAAQVAAIVGPTIITTAASVGASVAISALTAPSGRKPSSALIEVKDPLAPRIIHYGYRRVAGSLIFTDRTDDPDTPDLFKVLALSAREIDGIEQHYFADSPVTLVGTTVIDYDEEGTSYLFVTEYLGTDTQAADAELISEFPTVWTADHRGLGIAYAVVRYKGPNTAEKLARVFPNGAPEHQALIRGSKVYDPTLDSTNGGSGSCRINDKTTWVFTEEQRLIMLDYLLHPDCYDKGFPSGTAIEDRVLADCRIDWATWVPQILRGREEVEIRASGAEKRWRCSTSVDLENEEHTAVFTRIRQAGDARVFFTSEGKIACAGGGWNEPTVSLNASEHLIDAELGPIDRMASYNVLKFKFPSEEHGYIEQDGDPWRDEEAIISDGGVEREMEVELAVPSHSQGRRLCKIISARDNSPFSGMVKTKLAGLQVVQEDAVDFTFTELDGGTGDIDGPWWIEGEVSLDLETGAVQFGLKKAAPESYDWDAETEEGTPPIVPGDPFYWIILSTS